MNAFDVRIHAIRRRPDRRPFEVRWQQGASGPHLADSVARDLESQHHVVAERLAHLG